MIADYQNIVGPTPETISEKGNQLVNSDIEKLTTEERIDSKKNNPTKEKPENDLTKENLMHNTDDEEMKKNLDEISNLFSQSGYSSDSSCSSPKTDNSVKSLRLNGTFNKVYDGPNDNLPVKSTLKPPRKLLNAFTACSTDIAELIKLSENQKKQNHQDR